MADQLLRFSFHRFRFEVRDLLSYILSNVAKGIGYFLGNCNHILTAAHENGWSQSMLLRIVRHSFIAYKEPRMTQAHLRT